MTDLTPLLSDLLVHSHSKQSLPVVASLTRKLDNFLEEAYSIVCPDMSYQNHILTED